MTVRSGCGVFYVLPFMVAPTKRIFITAGSSGVQRAQTIEDDMVPSDAEVVPVEGVFRTGKRAGSSF